MNYFQCLDFYTQDLNYRKIHPLAKCAMCYFTIQRGWDLLIIYQGYIQWRMNSNSTMEDLKGKLLRKSSKDKVWQITHNLDLCLNVSDTI